MKRLLLVLLLGLSLFSCKPKQEEKKYDVVFDAKEVVVNPESIEDILVLPILPILSMDGYEFLGWYYDEGFTQQALDFDTLTSDVVLYAKWDKVGSGSFDTPIIPGN